VGAARLTLAVAAFGVWSSACAAHPATSRSRSDAPAAARSAPPPAPLPETAFRADDDAHGAPREPSPPLGAASRFETRRIGARDGAGAPRYHGAPVDLDLKDADLADVFRLLADVGRVNIVVGGEVSGKVTMRLRNVPWDQALDVIVRAKELSVERDGNVLLITRHAR
jgi:hypothetical protein